MGRPYMICHILSALDGKIAGTFMGTEAAQSTGEEYARIRSAYQAEAWVNGTTTTKEFTHDRKPILESVCGNLPEGDYITSTVPVEFIFKNVEQLKDSCVRLTYLVRQ